MEEEEGGFELIREGEIPQARQFPRALLRDSRLTFSAKGLFIFLWDLPIGWRIRATHLASIGPQRRDAIRSILRELVAVGALRVAAVRAERGRLSGKKWILRSPHLWAIEATLSRREPLEPTPAKDSTEGRETRLSGNPTFGKPAAKVINNIKVSSSTRVEILPAPAPDPDGSPTRNAFEIGPAGIYLWTAADRIASDQLIEKFGIESVLAAVERLEQLEKDPLPDRVLRNIKLFNRERRAAEKRDRKPTPAPKAHLNIDLEAQAAGEALLSQIRQQSTKQQGATP